MSDDTTFHPIRIPNIRPSIYANIRPLAYASEVGESFRPIINKNIVRTSYALSLGYVAFDIYVSTISASYPGKVACDKLIWHTFASMVIPAVTVHKIVNISSFTINKYDLAKTFKYRHWVPTTIGLLSIPFIIHPIDNLVTFVMDNSIRKLYIFKTLW